MDEVIRIFNENAIRYLVFGGQAVRLTGMPRFTMDWDIFIPGKDSENMQRINELLADELDLPLVPVGTRGENLIQTYQTRWGIIQFHLAVTGIPSFDEAEKKSVFYDDENGIKVKCLSLQDLIASKKSVSRPQDQADIDFLEIKAQ
ncbi:nucleotidyl transferase AbiEii/AbiGii toxin family protein [PVC group bacterium]|nr:nucleotidyl transferase AbiEii/AbiGii toxin family protein [PVC group bacterium]